MSHNQAFGRLGEDQAARWYRAHRYRLLARNWRCSEGEIDIIVAKGDVVVFVEVKARTSSRFGSPFDAVTFRKQQTIRTVANRWLASQSAWVPQLRFDVVAVGADGAIEVAEDCF